MIKNKHSTYHNKDLKMRISLINHTEYFLKLAKVDEKISGIMTTDLFTNSKNLRTNCTATTVSDKIIYIESETQDLSEKQIDEAYEYLKALEQQHRKSVITVIIALGYNNKVFEKKYGSQLFQPSIVEIEKFDGKKELSTLRKKLNNKEEFSDDDCAHLEAIPEMNFKKGTDIEAIIEEICYIMKEANIIESEKEKLISTMYYSIDYYIADEDKKIKLMEEIEMEKVMENQINHWVNIWKKTVKKMVLK